VNTLSIVTPSYRPKPRPPNRPYESILSQRCRPVDVGVVIQEDGDERRSGRNAPSDPRSSRELDDARSSTDQEPSRRTVNRFTLKNLDSDDVLGDGVLAATSPFCRAIPLSGGQRRGARPSPFLRRSTVGCPDATAGRLGRPVRGLLAQPRATGSCASTTICNRRGLAVALGGWRGCPAPTTPAC